MSSKTLAVQTPASEIQVGDKLLVFGRIPFKVVRMEKTGDRVTVFNEDGDGFWFRLDDLCQVTSRS